MAHDRASMMVPFTEETETNRESNILGQPTTRKASHHKITYSGRKKYIAFESKRFVTTLFFQKKS